MPEGSSAVMAEVASLICETRVLKSGVILSSDGSSLAWSSGNSQQWEFARTDKDALMACAEATASVCSFVRMDVTSAS